MGYLSSDAGNGVWGRKVRDERGLTDEDEDEDDHFCNSCRVVDYQLELYNSAHRSACQHPSSVVWCN